MFEHRVMVTPTAVETWARYALPYVADAGVFEGYRQNSRIVA